MRPEEMLKQYENCKKVGSEKAGSKFGASADMISPSSNQLPHERTPSSIDSERALKARLNDTEKDFVAYLASELPPIIGRSEVDRFLPGLVKPQTLAQADSAGIGPEIAWKLGRKVAYRTDSLLLWLVGRYGGVSRLVDIKKYLNVS